jgi:hypothetical protein
MVTVVLPLVVVVFTVAVVFAGTLGVPQFPAMWPAVGPPPRVAGRLMVIVVALTMEVIVAPGGIRGPEMVWPTDKPTVVVGAGPMVTVVLPTVVVAEKEVGTAD